MHERCLWRFAYRLLWGAVMAQLAAAFVPVPIVKASEPLAELEPAVIVNDEGGPVRISGQITYTYAFFTTGVAEPMVILEDQAGFVARDEHFIFPIESQTLGQITSDFYTSPFSYTISLPVEPQGSLSDIDNNGERDRGVMVFAIAYWTNTFGDPFLERRDLFGGGWSTAYASTRVSSDISTRREIVGGTFLVYSNDDQQGFPSGFGPDRLLFTDDDPIVQIPQGYTLVNMDTPTFTFDRSRYPTIDLIEPQSSVTEDFSGLPYEQAFDQMLGKLRREYAFTDFKGIDWEAIEKDFRPRFREAEIEQDSRAYRRALSDFIMSIPDGHFSGPFLANEFRRATAGGLGLAIRELDDGRVLVNYLLEDGPAAEAGIQLQAEITHLDGETVQRYLDDIRPWSAPFSTSHVERLQQLRYAVRLPLGQSRTVSFRNPDDSRPRTVTLKAIAEQESFQFSSLRRGLTGYELPLEYRVLDSGYVYVKIYRFSDNELLTIQLWERLLRTLNENDAPGLIIDMRQNSGGSGFLADQMAAYFFNREHVLGNAGRYNEESGDFYFDNRSVDRFFLPPENLRYQGDIAVLIGPNCNSACEFFSYDLTIEDRAVIVGQYPTAGLGGSIDVFIMPEKERIQFTAGRAIDMAGDIHIEGQGVRPHVEVPVNQKTLFGPEDPVLDAAIANLQNKNVEVVEAGRVEVNEVVTGTFQPNQRAQYTLPLAEGDVVAITLKGSSDEVDTVLRVYAKNGALIHENDDAPVVNARYSTITELTAEEDTSLVVEVASFTNQQRGNYTLQVERQGVVEPTAPLANVDLSDVQESETATNENAAGDNAAGDSAADDSTTDDSTTDDSTTDDNAAAVDASANAEADAIAASVTTAVLPPTPASVIADPPEEAKAPDVFGEATVVTQGGRLRVRAGPTTQAGVVGYIGLGTTYDIVELSRDGGWVRLLVEDLDDGDNGWVAIDYLDITIFE